jgi:hypothetical protein
MNESRFLSLMTKARMASCRGEHADYWHGYQRGVRRGFQGELFGTEAEHEEWMRLADGGPDKASRERGRGYRDGLKACAAEEDEALTGPPLNLGGNPTGPASRGYQSRR